jgi:hypothetical protein
MIGKSEFGRGQYDWIDMGSSQELQSSMFADSINLKPNNVFGEKRYIALRLVVTAEPFPGPNSQNFLGKFLKFS